MWFETKRVYLTAGTAAGLTPLNAFDNSLVAAGIAHFNLIRVSSIVPAGVPVEHLRSGSVIVDGEGRMAPTIYETIMSSDRGCEIASAVGVAVPRDQARCAVVFTYSGPVSRNQAEQRVSDMVTESMQVRGCTEYDIVVKAASAIVEKENTMVLSAAVFCDADLCVVFESNLSGATTRA